MSPFLDLRIPEDRQGPARLAKSMDHVRSSRLAASRPEAVSAKLAADFVGLRIYTAKPLAAPVAALGAAVLPLPFPPTPAAPLFTPTYPLPPLPPPPEDLIPPPLLPPEERILPLEELGE